MSATLKSCGILQESVKHYQVFENFQIGILHTVGCVFKRMSHSKTHESYERFKQFVLKTMLLSFAFARLAGVTHH